MLLKRILSPLPFSPKSYDWGILITRLGFGSLMTYNQGLSKFRDLAGGATEFPDPIGIGAYPSFVMTVFVELFCCALLAAGLFTRFTAFALVVTMLIIAFIVHSPDPFNAKEHALLYALVGTSLLLTGGGKYSLDALLFRQR